MLPALSPNTIASSLPSPVSQQDASTPDEPTLISRICQIFKNLIASISRCLHAIQTKIKNLFNNSAAPVSPAPDAPGVYLERRCECLPPRIDLLGTSGSFNIIERINRLGERCATCNHDYHANIIVKGLSHRVEFRENTGNRQRVNTAVAMDANEVRNHPLNTFYAYYQITIS